VTVWIEQLLSHSQAGDDADLEGMLAARVQIADRLREIDEQITKHMIRRLAERLHGDDGAE
jgi:hypothetical protein